MIYAKHVKGDLARTESQVRCGLCDVDPCVEGMADMAFGDIFTFLPTRPRHRPTACQSRFIV